MSRIMDKKRFKNEFWLQRYTYDNCVQLDNYAEKILDEIDEWRKNYNQQNDNKPNFRIKSKRSKRKKRSEHLKMLILNFLVKPGWINYRRSTDEGIDKYGKPKRNIQNHLNASSCWESPFYWDSTLKNLVDDLSDIGFLSKYLGGRQPIENTINKIKNEKDLVKRTSLKSLLKLQVIRNYSKIKINPQRRREIFDAGVDFNIIHQIGEYMSVIRIKNRSLDSQIFQSEKCIKIQHQLGIINSFIASADIRFDPPIEDFLRDHNMKDIRYGILENSQFYFRSFDFSFDHNGRYFGYFLQNINKKYKKYITMNGERVADLDFKCMYLTLGAAINGIHLEGEIVGSDSSGNPIYDYYRILDPNQNEFINRNVIKALIVRIFGVTSYEQLIESCKKPVDCDGLGLDESIAATYIDLICEKYSWLRNEIGLLRYKSLMNIESAIGTQVMFRCVGERIPFVNMHDGFIVPLSAAETVQRYMKIEYKLEIKKRNIKMHSPQIVMKPIYDSDETSNIQLSHENNNNHEEFDYSYPDPFLSELAEESVDWSDYCLNPEVPNLDFDDTNFEQNPLPIPGNMDSFALADMFGQIFDARLSSTTDDRNDKEIQNPIFEEIDFCSEAEILEKIFNKRLEDSNQVEDLFTPDEIEQIKKKEYEDQKYFEAEIESCRLRVEAIINRID